MRPDYDKLPAAQWTEPEAMHHLTGTFDHACKYWPGIMERYMAEIVEAEPGRHKEIMRRGLRETLKDRL